MSSTSPWDAIDVPNADFNVRQVATKAAVPSFWGRDATGACLFIVELEGDHRARFRAEVVPVHGISIDLRAEGQEHQRLVLTLEKQVDRDLFEGLCQTLVKVVERASDSATALALALAHVRRWKNFLSGRVQRLSQEAVRGLFAEMTFLLDLVTHGMRHADATSAWLGPDRSHQDFIFGDTAVEIKSLAGTERNFVRISSEDQLESLNDKLFLRIYRLNLAPDSNHAKSLNGLVQQVFDTLEDSDAIDEFERKLAASGYAPVPDYDQPRFMVSEVRTFAVEEGFPCLVRTDLPAGIDHLSYDIRLEAIAEFRCDDLAVFGDM